MIRSLSLAIAKAILFCVVMASVLLCDNSTWYTQTDATSTIRIRFIDGKPIEGFRYDTTGKLVARWDF